LSANPNNQAALDGMDMLDGKLVQASEVPPSLLESRLSAIGMGNRPPTARPAPAVSHPPSPEAATITPIAPPPTDIAWEEETGQPSEQPGRRRIVLLVAVVLFLFLVVCILVAATVVPPLLKGF
jgi:hypothetical protein